MGGFGAAKPATAPAPPAAPVAEAAAPAAKLTAGSRRPVRMGTFGGAAKPADTNQAVHAPARAPAPEAAIAEDPAETAREEAAKEARHRAGQLEQGVTSRDKEAGEVIRSAEKALDDAAQSEFRLGGAQTAYDKTQPKGWFSRMLRKVATTLRLNRKQLKHEATLLEHLNDARQEHETALGEWKRADQLASAAKANVQALKGELTLARRQAIDLSIRLAAKERAARMIALDKQGAVSFATRAEAVAAGSDPIKEGALAQGNQHLLTLARSPGLRAAYQAAAAKYQLSAYVEPKPKEVAEDAFAAAPERGLFALGDGLTNSDFSGTFARALVRNFAANPPAQGALEPWLKAAQKEFQDTVTPRAKAGRVPVGNSTFVGVQLLKDGGRRQMRVVGIGNSLLFVLRKGELLGSFPISESKDMVDATHGLASNGTVPQRTIDTRIDTQAGDEVFMVTDALGKWALQELETGRDPFPKIRAVKNKQQMSEFVRTERGPNGIRKMDVDDTAFVRFVVPAE
jgi:hypothetical protein